MNILINLGYFKPEMWNHFETTSPRTNNHIEGFNNRMKHEVTHLHPSVGDYIEAIKRVEIEVAERFVELDNNLSSPRTASKEKIERVNFYIFIFIYIFTFTF